MEYESVTSAAESVQATWRYEDRSIKSENESQASLSISCRVFDMLKRVVHATAALLGTRVGVAVKVSFTADEFFLRSHIEQTLGKREQYIEQTGTLLHDILACDVR
ncbi:hypothetical protein EVAR_10408_1 [Eumeta japonica]|uniref:Uncharacterized protein n=1 Tax=Eumeta variegata TaxID=151549 RepID=A0A4C1UCG2_EUMVA|nr:hypothetical protein EVAR_10408_1 [Eumeta japonica]